MQKKISVFSFFSGIGILDLGFESAGFEVVYTNEYWPEFARAYLDARSKLGIEPPKYGMHVKSIENLLDEKHTLEISKYIEAERQAGNLVCFIGGPPCPDFSVAGKNKGKDGENGKLSRTYIELIKNQKPDIFLFENVKGLWRTKKHREFYDSLKRKLKAGGYALTDRLINSIQYGAPQDRDRILLIGFKSDLFEGSKKGRNFDSLFEWTNGVRYTDREAFKFDWPAGDGTSQGAIESLPEELTVSHWFAKNKVSDHLNQRHVFNPKAGISKFTTVKEGDVSRKSYKRLHRFRYSPTAAYGNNEVHIHPTLPRRITAAEAMAIQTLPANFELPHNMTLTNMFKSIGNGVPYVVALGIAGAIRNTVLKLGQ
jgi:DNA (cytosine-5)-methyltransferase 1